MRSTIVILLMLLVGPGVSWSAPQSGQDSQNASPSASQMQEKSQSQDQTMLTAAGELSRIDAQKQLLWIKTAAGEEMQFSYTKDTPISGAGDSVEGLKDSGRGTQLKVEYQTKGGVNTAVQIEVQSQAS